MIEQTTFMNATCDVCGGDSGQHKGTLEQQIQALKQYGWITIPETNRCACANCVDTMLKLLKVGFLSLNPEAQRTVLADAKMTIPF